MAQNNTPAALTVDATATMAKAMEGLEVMQPSSSPFSKRATATATTSAFASGIAFNPPTVTAPATNIPATDATTLACKTPEELRAYRQDQAEPNPPPPLWTPEW